jgi:hypothetical protein
MNGFVTMVADGMRARGHDVELWRPEGLVRRLGIGRARASGSAISISSCCFRCPRRCGCAIAEGAPLVVLGDHALGMWMSFLWRWPHVIHSHDFNPQRELAGDFPSRRPQVDRPPVSVADPARLWARQCVHRRVVATARDLARFHPGPPPRCDVSTTV